MTDAPKPERPATECWSAHDDDGNCAGKPPCSPPSPPRSAGRVWTLHVLKDECRVYHHDCCSPSVHGDEEWEVIRVVPEEDLMLFGWNADLEVCPLHLWD